MRKLWRKFKRFFTRNYSTPTVDYGGYGDGLPEFKPVWCLVKPHYSWDGGAETPDNKWSEYSYSEAMYPLINIPLVDDRNDDDIRGACKRMKAAGANAYLECHKDAYNHSVDGYSFLYLKGDKLSKKYCELFRDEYKKTNFNRIARYSNGLKALEPGDPGYRNLVQAKKYMDVAIYSECFFIDSHWIEPSVQAKFWNRVLV